MSLFWPNLLGQVIDWLTYWMMWPHYMEWYKKNMRLEFMYGVIFNCVLISCSISALSRRDRSTEFGTVF